MSSPLHALIAQWRENAKSAAKLANEYEGDSAGNSHAFRKERRIWTTCADELEALLASSALRDKEGQQTDQEPSR